MLATADYGDRYSEPTTYEHEWIDNHSIRIPWLNYLTAQSIPEETDDIDSPLNLRRYNSHSDCSSSSEEDYYVVFEVERPRSTDGTTHTIEKEFNFAEINEDEHHVEYNQFTGSMIIETPSVEHLIGYEIEEKLIVEEYATVTQLSSNILFHTIKNSDKQMDVTNSISSKYQNRSTSSNDEFSKITNFKTIEKIKDYRSTSISFVVAKQQSKNIQFQGTNFDSIANKSSNQTQVANNLSQRTSNLIQAQQKPPKEPKILPSECIHGRVQDLKNDYNKLIQSRTNTSLGKTNFKEETSHAVYSNYKSNTIVQPTSNRSSLSNSLSKASAIIRAVTNHTRINKSDYPIYDIVNNEFNANEPKLLQVKYYDGRDALTSINEQESLRKGRTLSSSISARLSITKMSSTHDLSNNPSYRKRMLNRFQTFLKTNSVEEESSNSIPEQQKKAIMELFNERKNKITRY